MQGANEKIKIATNAKNPENENMQRKEKIK